MRKRIGISITIGFALFCFSCTHMIATRMSENYWKKPNTSILLETNDIIVFSMTPTEFQVSGGSWHSETNSYIFSDRFFEVLSNLENVPSLPKDLNFQFVKDIPSEWKEKLKQGVFERGNATIYYKAPDSKFKYLGFAAYSQKEKEKQLKVLRTFDKKNYKVLQDLDPSGTRQMTQVGAYKVGVASMLIGAFIDNSRIDFFWTGHDKNFKVKTFSLE
ncbi:MAG: hypothetical protein HZA10_04805 [Nitrospirae bacterium]|nr:hypothetical protein [Nitrospirota bacterium]